MLLLAGHQKSGLWYRAEQKRIEPAPDHRHPASQRTTGGAGLCFDERNVHQQAVVVVTYTARRMMKRGGRYRKWFQTAAPSSFLRCGSGSPKRAPTRDSKEAQQRIRGEIIEPDPVMFASIQVGPAEDYNHTVSRVESSLLCRGHSPRR